MSGLTRMKYGGKRSRSVKRSSSVKRSRSVRRGRSARRGRGRSTRRSRRGGNYYPGTASGPGCSLFECCPGDTLENDNSGGGQTCHTPGN